MKNCRNCGNDIDKELYICPHCKMKQPPLVINKKMGPVTKIILGLIGFGMPILLLYLFPFLVANFQDEALKEKDEKEQQEKQEEIIENTEIIDSLDYVTKINYGEFRALINGGNGHKDTYIMVGDYADPVSIDFLKKVNRTLIDYDYEVFYLDMSILSKNEIEDVKNIGGIYKDFDQIPCLYFVRLNEDHVRINKDITFDEYKSFIESNGVRRKVKR